jgi:hypothetical protein
MTRAALRAAALLGRAAKAARHMVCRKACGLRPKAISSWEHAMKPTLPLFLLAGALALPAAAQSPNYSDRTFGFRDDVNRWVLPSQPIAQPVATAQPVLVLENTPTEPVAPAAAQPALPAPDVLLAGAVTPIPEPTTSALLLAGLGVVGLLYRRRSKK